MNKFNEILSLPSKAYSYFTNEGAASKSSEETGFPNEELSLPDELILEIYSRLIPASKLEFPLVSKKIYRVTGSNINIKIYKIFQSYIKKKGFSTDEYNFITDLYSKGKVLREAFKAKAKDMTYTGHLNCKIECVQLTQQGSLEKILSHRSDQDAATFWFDVVWNSENNLLKINNKGKYRDCKNPYGFKPHREIFLFNKKEVKRDYSLLMNWDWTIKKATLFSWEDLKKENYPPFMPDSIGNLLNIQLKSQIKFFSVLNCEFLQEKFRSLESLETGFSFVSNEKGLINRVKEEKDEENVFTFKVELISSNTQSLKCLKWSSSQVGNEDPFTSVYTIPSLFRWAVISKTVHIFSKHLGIKIKES